MEEGEVQDEDMVAQLRDSLYYSNKQRRKKRGRAGRQLERSKQKEAQQPYDWRVSEDQSNHCSTAHSQQRH